MIYFAIVLILAGIAFFLYAYYEPVKQKKESPVRPERKMKTSYRPMAEEETVIPVNLKATLLNRRYPEHKFSQEVENKIRQERVLSAKFHFPEIQDAVIPEREVFYEDEPKKVSVVGTVKENSNGYSNEIFRLNGTLYFDYSRKIPFTDRKIREKIWDEADFTHFSRIGKVKMLEIDGVLQFRSGQIYHEFSLEQIEEIVFYEKAFSLIPANPSLPSTLVFSEESESFKNLLSVKNI